MTTIELKKFKLLKSILDYPVGYIVHVYKDEGWLGLEPEWKIPLKIIINHLEWFEKLDI